MSLGKGNLDPISICQAFNFAWPVFKKRFGFFTSVLLTIFGAWVVLEIIVILGQRFGILLWAMAHLAFVIFVAGVELGFLHACLTLYDQGQPTFADIFSYLALGPKFLAGQILYLLMVLVGLLLLVVPGAYLSVRYSLFGFCMADGETNLMGSFQQSSILTAGIRICLLWIFIALLVLNALGACLLGIGLFITVPLSVLMMTAVYRQLSARRLVVQERF
ncbi:MAG: hypothetical protein ACHP8A_18735 [Terriglobales bacterium]|jgi:uncharacterized membrane protein|nr:hypothetical protein [Terriglobales bacterium]